MSESAPRRTCRTSRPPCRHLSSAASGSSCGAALTFLGMTLVLPGSAQIAAGNRRVGRIAVRIWVGLWVAALLIGLFALVWRSAAVAAVHLRSDPAGGPVRPDRPRRSAGACCSSTPGGSPGRRSSPGGTGSASPSSTWCWSARWSAAWSPRRSMVSAQRDLMGTVFAGGGDQQAKQGRYNILLMGGDAGKDRSGLRPDSMTVASVDAETGRTVLISLPRNLEDVPFPASSPLHKKFPKGYTCADHSCMLNAIYTYATDAQGPLSPASATPAPRPPRRRSRAHRAEDQLLGADRPQGLRGSGRRGRRDHHGRLPAGPDRRRERQDLRLRRGGQEPAPRRSRGVVVRPVAVGFRPTTTGWCGRSA